MSRTLTESDIQRAADSLGVERAAILAVCEVEAPRGGFLPDGRPVILFERHKFHRFTRGRFAAEAPDLSSPKPGGYLGGAREWSRYDRAAALDERSAMLATSWGRFQIMGFNFTHCGFATVEEFVEAMSESEGRQLEAFVDLIESFGLVDELRRHDWAGFAYGYNGPKYKQNRYDSKLAAAYRRYATEAPSPNPAFGVTDDWDEPEETKPVPVKPEPRPGRGSAPEDPSVKVTQNSNKAWYTQILAWLTGAGTGAVGFVQQNRTLLYMAVVVVLFVVVAWYVRSIILDLARLKLHADPDKYNVH